jgi:hypothetical protein
VKRKNSQLIKTSVYEKKEGKKVETWLAFTHELYDAAVVRAIKQLIPNKYFIYLGRIINLGFVFTFNNV